jgi:aldehyde dehydrogenase (NAD+)
MRSWSRRAAQGGEIASVGPGIERAAFGANMGAMVSEPQRDRAACACRTGAGRRRARVTGGRPEPPGWFLEPTV